MDQVSASHISSDRDEYLSRLTILRARYQDLDAYDLLETAIKESFPNKIAMTSSFGSESVVELHMIAQIDPSVPVIFLNTGKLFPETLRYRDLLQERFGLIDVRSIGPDPKDRQNLDPQGLLWRSKPDMCCHFRKVVPLERALEGFEATITGRKRFQTQSRQSLSSIELQGRPDGFDGFRFTINPLAAWTLERLEKYIAEHKLPRHPLVKDGYASIGCMPCTDRVVDGGYRDGRWRGQEKEECGIYQSSFAEGEGI